MATKPNTPNSPSVAKPAPTAAELAEAAAKLKAKQDKFVELANARVGKAMDAIEKVGNLAKYKGAFTTEQVAKIEEHLNKTLDTTLNAFKNALAGGKATGGKFNL